MSGESNTVKDLILFSVVMPTYNQAPVILPTIHSVLDQTYPHFEFLIIDDGSAGNTREVV